MIKKQKSYFMGDTNLLDSMKELSCNYSFIPVGETYTMTEDEAVELTNQIKPRVVFSIHYGMIV